MDLPKNSVVLIDTEAIATKANGGKKLPGFKPDIPSAHLFHFSDHFLKLERLF